MKEELSTLIATVVLPTNPSITVVGGDGAQYECGGTNWIFDDPENATMQEAGKWRIEVVSSKLFFMTFSRYLLPALITGIITLLSWIFVIMPCPVALHPLQNEGRQTFLKEFF